MTIGLLTEPMLDDYAATDKPDWTHEDEGHHFFFHHKFGQLEVGKVPGKPWDQWLFHENAGGGAMVIGYAVIDDELNVLMLKANRFNLEGDEDDYEGPGGFVDEEDNSVKLATAIRELLEETDLLANPEPVSGRGYVGNRAFFQLDGEDEGTSVFTFELTDEQVKAANKSDKLALMPWRDAIRTTRDALSGMAIARLIADRL